MFETQGPPLGQAISSTVCLRPPEQTRPGSQDHNGHIGRGSHKARHRKGQTQRHEGQVEIATGKRCATTRTGLFISLGVRFGRIWKTNKGIPSPQL